jgi:starvation-inducible outer membrane lipoprotein
MKTILIIFIILLLSACATPPSFHRTVVIPQTTVHVFSSSYPAGLTMKGTVLISGKIIKGAVVMDKDAAWHEFQHLLNMENPVFCNPDKDCKED